MSEKTEEATPKRKRKARMDGDVAKSGEFSGVMVMFAAFGTLLASSTMIFTRLLDFMRHTITLVSRESLGPEVIERFMLDGLLTLAECIGPMLGVAFVAAAFFTYIQIGALFTMKPLIPDANRLNMANNAKNLVNKDKLVELVKKNKKITELNIRDTYLRPLFERLIAINVQNNKAAAEKKAASNPSGGEAASVNGGAGSKRRRLCSTGRPISRPELGRWLRHGCKCRAGNPSPAGPRQGRSMRWGRGRPCASPRAGRGSRRGR